MNISFRKFFKKSKVSPTTTNNLILEIVEEYNDQQTIVTNLSDSLQNITQGQQKVIKQKQKIITYSTKSCKKRTL